MSLLADLRQGIFVIPGDMFGKRPWQKVASGIKIAATSIAVVAGAYDIAIGTHHLFGLDERAAGAAHGTSAMGHSATSHVAGPIADVPVEPPVPPREAERAVPHAQAAAEQTAFGSVPYPERKPPAPPNYELSIPQQMRAAIIHASHETGVSMSWLMVTGGIESRFGEDTVSKSSSARGPFQFLKQPWLAMLGEYGDQHGYGDIADGLMQTKKGDWVAKDGKTMKRALALRDDLKASALMAAHLTIYNRESLTKRLGRVPDDAEIYLAYLLGAGTAEDFIRTARKNPNALARDYFKQQARSNPGLFLDVENGRKPRTFAQMKQVIAAKFRDADYLVASLQPETLCKATIDAGVRQEEFGTCVTKAYAKPDVQGSMIAFTQRLDGWREQQMAAVRQKDASPGPS